MASRNLKMRRSLFGDSPQPQDSPISEWSVSVDSPVSEWSASDIAAFITPDSKADNSGIGSDTKYSKIEIPSFTPLCKKSGIRKKLFSKKRPADDQEIDDSLPPTKKLRDLPTHLSTCTLEGESTPDPSTSITEAVEQLTSEPDLIADGSCIYHLPTIPGKHSDLKAISPDTVADVLSGNYDNQLGQVTIIDCRYPYEFDGGHIRRAENRYTKDDIHSLLTTAATTSDKPQVLIFHCEFSSERGPKMYRFLRAQDRELNKDHYPRLNFPEVYLLEGGYKAFYTQHKDLCAPDTYMPMLHADHGEDLRHFRVKSKSWAAGDKAQKPKRRTLRRSLTPLTLSF